MRNKILLFAFALMSAFGVQAQTSGGPDTYGYVWRNSNDAQGPAYVWNSIAGAPGATQVTGLADDNSVGPFNLNGWSFHYYWTDVSSWKLGSNGWVGFNNIGNIAHCFPTVPTQGGSGDNFIAPYMSDLNFAGGTNPGEVWYWDNGSDTLVIEWVNAPWWVNSNPDWIGSNTFQMVLSGVDSSITFYYNDVDQTNFNNTANCNADLEIGMENITGNIGLEVLNETVPSDQIAYKFYYPSTVTFQVPDATPAWNANSDNAGQFYLAGAAANSVDMIANIGNVGNADITNTINIAGDIRLPGAGSAFWTSTTSINGLAAGSDQTVTFPDQVVFNTPNVHYAYKVTTTNSQDINPSNNQNTVEVIAAECTGDTMNLGYSSGTQPDGVVVWSGGAGNEGGAVYIVPPVYPATISNIDVYIADIDQAPGVVDGFGVAVYADGGMPGALLDSAGVAANAATENAWNRVRMSQAPVITSGGFYVAWYQGGANVAMGTETIAPISRRTYEILGGSWAPYRQITVDDFMISANISVTCPAVGVKDAVASELNLRAMPNPSNGPTNIRFDLSGANDVKINIVNVFGQVVFNENLSGLAAGTHTISFDAGALAAGVYYVNVETASEAAVTKLVINR